MPHVFFTDSDFSTKDKNFRYILWFQPSFWAIILWKEKIDIFLDARYIWKINRVDKAKLRQRVCCPKPPGEKCVEINFIEFKNWSIGLFKLMREELKWSKKVTLENNIAIKYAERLKWDYLGAPWGYKMEYLENYFTNKREIKEDIEKDKIKKAIEIVDKAFRQIENMVNSWEIFWMTEMEVRNIIAVNMLEHGWRKESFVSIVAFWENSAIPHHSAWHTKIWNWVLLIDMWTIYEWYCSDFSRTFWVWKKNKQYDRFIEIYEIVKKAHNKVVEWFQIWMLARDLDKLARDVIDDSWHGEEFTHSIGHWVWLQIHEMPKLSKDSEELIVENMVFTVEPWIYIKWEFWVRLEDIVFVENGRLKKYSTIDL